MMHNTRLAWEYAVGGGYTPFEVDERPAEALMKDGKGALLDEKHVAKVHIRRKYKSPALDGLHAEIARREMVIALRVFASPASSSDVTHITTNPHSTPDADAGTPSPPPDPTRNFPPKVEPEQERGVGECGARERECKGGASLEALDQQAEGLNRFEEDGLMSAERVAKARVKRENKSPALDAPHAEIARGEMTIALRVLGAAFAPDANIPLSWPRSWIQHEIFPAGWKPSRIVGVMEVIRESRKKRNAMTVLLAPCCRI